jgi:hypothetical protein
MTLQSKNKTDQDKILEEIANSLLKDQVIKKTKNFKTMPLLTSNDLGHSWRDIIRSVCMSKIKELSEVTKNDKK